MVLLWLLKKVHSLINPQRNAGSLRHKLNVKADPRDERDKEYAFKSPLSETKMPEVYEIPREFHSPVKSQGRVGSCASHVAADLVELEVNINSPNRSLPLSELWHYYTVRSPAYMNTLPEDSGAYLRDVCKVLREKGIAPELTWPYDVSKFNDKPPWYADAFARLYRIKSYHRIYSVKDIKKSIALNHPVMVGILVFDSFLKNKDGIITMPNPGETSLGGHALVVTAYNSKNKTLRVKNSWSRRWGNKGYADIPESYFLRYGLDYWSVRV